MLIYPPGAVRTDHKMMKDPVCGMMVDEKKGALKSEYKGKTYYFCSASCKKSFDMDPGRYAGSPV